jgi:hypothetical protein
MFLLGLLIGLFLAVILDVLHEELSRRETAHDLPLERCGTRPTTRRPLPSEVYR